MAISPTHLRANLYKILDKVIETQKPVEIVRNGQKLRIVPEKKATRSKLENLEAHPGTICGDPEDLVHVDWSSYWKGKKEL